MTTSDLDTLLDMGFDPERAQIAIKQTGGLQGAIDWLEANQDKPIEELKAAPASTEEQEPELQPGEQPHSLICDDCGRKLRSHAQAEFHASKTGHENFSESTEEIAPLTEEERAQKLQDLKERLSAKRAMQSEQEKAEQKRNEEIRRKSTKEQKDIQEDLVRKEAMKDAEKKRREKVEDAQQRKKTLAKIAADKEERRRKAELEKAQRTGQPLPEDPAVPIAAAAAATAPPPSAKPSAAYTETRLRLQTDKGNVQKSFPVETTLFEVAHAVNSETGIEVSSFTTPFPRKTFDEADFGMTLKEAGFVPSAALIIK